MQNLRVHRNLENQAEPREQERSEVPDPEAGSAGADSENAGETKERDPVHPPRGTQSALQETCRI